MELSAFQISKIELIADYEAAVMELYWVYSEKFPEHKDFWIDMADDERRNVEWVRSTIELIKAGKVDYNRERFNIEAVKYISQCAFRINLFFDDFSHGGRQ